MGPTAPFSLALCNSVELDWPTGGFGRVFKSLITRGKVKRSFYNDGLVPLLVAKHSPELRIWEFMFPRTYQIQATRGLRRDHVRGLADIYSLDALEALSLAW